MSENQYCHLQVHDYKVKDAVKFFEIRRQIDLTLQQLGAKLLEGATDNITRDDYISCSFEASEADMEAFTIFIYDTLELDLSHCVTINISQIDAVISGFKFSLV